MDGRGRCMDNIFTERLWRTVKYEEMYLKSYADMPDAQRNLAVYFRFYDQERPHQALGYQTPAEVYFKTKNSKSSAKIQKLTNPNHSILSTFAV
jgi:putative transposase